MEGDGGLMMTARARALGYGPDLSFVMYDLLDRSKVSMNQENMIMEHCLNGHKMKHNRCGMVG